MVAVVNEVVDEFSFEMFKRIEVLNVKRFGFEYPEEVFYYSICLLYTSPSPRDS